MSFNEPNSQKRFKCMNLLCDSARGNGQFFGGGGDAAASTQYFEGLHSPQRRSLDHLLNSGETKCWEAVIDLVYLKQMLVQCGIRIATAT
jgi:hypothetical protein